MNLPSTHDRKLAGRNIQKEKALRQDIANKAEEIAKIRREKDEQIELQKRENNQEIIKLRDTYNDKLSKQIAECKEEGQATDDQANDAWYWSGYGWYPGRLSRSSPVLKPFTKL